MCTRKNWEKRQSVNCVAFLVRKPFSFIRPKRLDVYPRPKLMTISDLQAHNVASIFNLFFNRCVTKFDMLFVQLVLDI